MQASQVPETNLDYYFSIFFGPVFVIFRKFKLLATDQLM